MSNVKYFIKGFELLGKKLQVFSEVDKLLNDDNVSLLELEHKLIEISDLATMERKENLKESILGWGFITGTALSLYLSSNLSSYFYILSIPLLLVTSIYLLFILPEYQDNLSKAIKITFIKLMFIYEYGMLDYIKGINKDKFHEPRYSYIYMEKRIKFKIKNYKS